MVQYENSPYERWLTYMLRGILYVEHVLKVIISFRPYMDQYGPVLQQVITLYKIMQMMKEEQVNEEEQINESSTKTNAPLLYI